MVRNFFRPGDDTGNNETVGRGEKAGVKREIHDDALRYMDTSGTTDKTEGWPGPGGNIHKHTEPGNIRSCGCTEDFFDETAPYEAPTAASARRLNKDFAASGNDPFENYNDEKHYDFPRGNDPSEITDDLESGSEFITAESTFETDKSCR